MNLSDRLNNPTLQVTHHDDAIMEVQDSVITLADITKLRVYVAGFPYSAIAYNADDNYRKSGIDPQDESIRSLGRGIAESGLQQPIGLFAAELSAADLQGMIGQGLDLSSPDTWRTPIHTIFGNRRYLAITHHTTINNEAAYIYPKEAESWRKTIALIENMDREDVPLIEEAVGLFNLVTDRFRGNVSRFAEFSGKDANDLVRIYKIGEAATKDATFHAFVKNEKTADKIALDNIARALLAQESTHRSKKVEQVLKDLTSVDGKIAEIRKKAKALRDYAEAKTNTLPTVTQSKPTVPDDEDAPRNEVVKTKESDPEEQIKKQSLQIIKKINELRTLLEKFEITQEVDDALNVLSEAITTKLSGNEA